MRHAASAQPIPPGTQLRMAILATSDLHQHVIGYNYYSLTEDPSVGLDRTATLIQRMGWTGAAFHERSVHPQNDRA